MDLISNVYEQIFKATLLRFNEANALSILNKVGTLILFFLPVTNIFWPAYIIVLAHSAFRLSLEDLKKEVWFIGLFTLLLVAKMIQFPGLNNVLFLKNFAGMYLFYYYFRYVNKIDITKWLISLTIVCIGINFLINATNIYSITMFQSFDKLQKYLLQSAYTRPISLWENATVMAVVILCFLIGNLKETYAFLEKKYLYLTTIIIGSGVGFVGLILHSIFKIKITMKHLIVAAIMVVSYVTLYYFSNVYIYQGNIFYKISPDYIFFLLNQKYDFILAITSKMSLSELLIGNPITAVAPTGSDFGWLAILTTGGILGITINVAIFSKLFKYKKEIVFLLILSTFHYHTALWSMGQIFLGYLAAHLFLENEDAKLANP